MITALSSLPRVDYADSFTVATDAVASPERWARAMFGDVPSAGELLIWRGFLGLRLSRGRSPATVAGWWIGDRGDEWIRLETESWFLAANMVVRSGGGQLSLDTFVHYKKRIAYAVWRPLSVVHRFLAPRVVRDTAARMAPAAAASG
jgi:hypothetical protein